ncbi:hypothetical protein BC936DRAFT_147236 [Jimgerdemannia flammicorona]|uniref:Uncharacterized protein n=1 Tax=Jimgerdemannia flammicorona TaxID=994334 RepID=A0A433DL75_9FUNG|nr:hypothetical protein BC936DRAFT_147236 [Jimgerdemannia flammicorona]
MAQTDKHSVVLWYLHAHTATHCITREPNPDYINHNTQRDHTKPVPKKTVTFKTSKINLKGKGIHEVIIPAPAIPHLLTLRALRLESNHLATLPLHLFHLTGLYELNLAHNRLINLPPELGLLTSLRELFVHNNALTDLPPQIGLLTHLTHLDITTNKLRYLPAEIARLGNLQKFWAEGNWFPDSSTLWGSEIGDADHHIDDSVARIFPPLPRRQPLRLTAICAQIVGTALSTSPHHYCDPSPSPSPSITPTDTTPTCTNHAPDLLPHTTLTFVQPPGGHPSLAIPCARCGAALFHAGVPLVEGGVRKCGTCVTVVHRVCGQACWTGMRFRLEGVVRWEERMTLGRSSVAGGEGRRRRGEGVGGRGRFRSRTI